jgi:hypothetical protein
MDMTPQDKDAKQFAIMACTPFKHFPTDGSQFPYLGELKEDDTVESIIRRLYETAFNSGKSSGEYEKQQEIKKVLGIKENDD